jgi:hypothetical protein
MDTRFWNHAGPRRLIVPALLVAAMLSIVAVATAAGRTTERASAPTVTSVSPNTAPNDGSVSMTVEGSGFDVRGRMSAKLVRGGTVITGSVRASRADRALARFELTGAPTGTYDVVIANSEGQEGKLTAGFTVTGVAVPKPQITKIAPTSGKRKATVTITGTGFGASGGTRFSFVKFGAKKCTTYASWTGTKIKCKVPSKAVFGKVKVSVTTAGGVSNTKTFTVKKP